MYSVVKFRYFSCEKNTQKLEIKKSVGKAKNKQNDKCIVAVVGEVTFVWTAV